MPMFKGLNTIDQVKKFTLTDFELIKRDLLNAFMTWQGSMPGRPDLGTNIWAYIFEPNDTITRRKIENEVRRIITSDPRLSVQDIIVSSQENVIIIEASIIIVSAVEPQTLFLLFDKDSQSVSIQ